MAEAPAGLSLAGTAALSPDGRHLYVPTGTLNPAVAAFERAGETGELSFLSTGGIDDPLEKGFVEGARSGVVVASPDGRHVYVLYRITVASQVAVFSRNPATGALAFAGGPFIAGGADFVGSLGNSTHLAMSPDGRNVYTPGGPTVRAYERSPRDGLLTLQQTLDVEHPSANSGGVSVAISPDGKNVYVAIRGGHRLVVLTRDERTGELSLVEQQVSDMLDPTGGVEGLFMPYFVAVGPDGAHVYVSSREYGSVTFGRDVTTGRLTFVEVCCTDPHSDQGVSLRFVTTTFSPDGNTLYIGTNDLGPMLLFHRDRLSGRLTFMESVDLGGVRGLRGVPVASADGQNVYAATGLAVVVFRVNP